jgi:hypothetical protein
MTGEVPVPSKDSSVLSQPALINLVWLGCFCVTQFGLDLAGGMTGGGV